jgi:unsaturated rhamnogalacturonyl hydrolase
MSAHRFSRWTLGIALLGLACPTACSSDTPNATPSTLGSGGNAAGAGGQGLGGTTDTGGNAGDGTAGGSAGNGASGGAIASGGASSAAGGSTSAGGGGSAGRTGSGGNGPDGSVADARPSDGASALDVTAPLTDATVPLGIAPDTIVQLMRRAADWGYANDKSYGHTMASGNDWSTGTFYTGMTATWRVTQDAAYRQKIVDWGTANQWLPKTVTPDDMACMQTYFEMYILEPDKANEGRYLPSKAKLDAELATNPKGSGWFWWEDGLYMGPADIAMLGAITSDRSYFDKLTAIWFSATDAYCDATTHLCFWKADWIYPKKATPNGNPEYWGPGNAWVMGGLIRILKYMPVDYTDRPRWVKFYQDMCEALRTRQQPDGFWRTSLYEPTEFPDPESSSTSFFTYAMGLGMLYGLLDQPTYMPVVKKGWTALTTVVDAQGKVGRCQPWSNQPGAVCATCNTPEGQGAFLLAAEAMYLLSER